MKWTQRFEGDDLDTIDELLQFVKSLNTEGTIQHASVEVVSDSPITVTLPENKEQTSSSDSQQDKTPQTPASESEHKYSVDSTTTQSPEPQTDPLNKAIEESQKHSTVKTEPDSPVAVRKWPRLNRVVDSESDLPISAAAYPHQVKDFTGNNEAAVEQDASYYARVNGTKEYGAFVTLNGSGYSPNSKYNEITGLLHHSEMLRKGPLAYSQGDRVVVQLVKNSEKGLSFREQPLLNVDQAKQARHSEKIRLNRLGITVDDTVSFSNWPETRELTGTITDINQGSDNPVTPPIITVETVGGTHTIQPSDIVATTNTTISDHVQPSSTETENNPSPTEQSQSQISADGATTTVTSSPPSTTASESTSTTQQPYQCDCGETFSSQPQMWGHQSSCEAYQSSGEDEKTTTTANESKNGRVLNPILLDPRYQYTKTAIIIHQSNKDELSAGDIADAVEGTEWEVPRSNINTNLETLRDKDAATRHKDSVYLYQLTDRGVAGVERAIKELDNDIPDFNSI